MRVGSRIGLSDRKGELQLSARDTARASALSGPQFRTSRAGFRRSPARTRRRSADSRPRRVPQIRLPSRSTPSPPPPYSVGRQTPRYPFSPIAFHSSVGCSSALVFSHEVLVAEVSPDPCDRLAQQRLLGAQIEVHRSGSAGLGRGHGRMPPSKARDVETRGYIRSGGAAVGQEVTGSPLSSSAPSAVTLGWVGRRRTRCPPRHGSGLAAPGCRSVQRPTGEARRRSHRRRGPQDA